MEKEGSQQLRESLRILVRILGILEKSDVTNSSITLTQCHALVEIGRRGQLSLIELSSVLEVDKSTMSRTINHLVTAGLVLREVDAQNRRYVSIRLSDQGQSTFEAIEESMGAYYQGIFSGIPEGLRGQVLSSLEILTQAVKKSNETAT